MVSALLPRGGESGVENPVENVENIHFVLYKTVEKSARPRKIALKIPLKRGAISVALRK